MSCDESAGSFEAVVHGRVQGVGYRYSAQRRATELGLSGTVRNSDLGTVEVVALGSRDHLEQFALWLKQGPPHARVDRVEIHWQSLPGGSAVKPRARFTVIG